MQLICRFDTIDWPEWKAAFDEGAEDRAQHSIQLLQVWRDADSPSAAVALFEVHDRAKAEAWIRKETGFGAALRADFLKTA